jgi:hypothetical protein
MAKARHGKVYISATIAETAAARCDVETRTVDRGDMAEERRFQEEEIRAIFAAAAESPDSSDSSDPASPTGGDLTLRDLQEIGMEIGIPPERITAAAQALDQRQAVVPRKTYLGMPIAVGRTVDLPRAPTDREWAILVSDIRETFRARGRVVSQGDMREWTSGNLHASVEPTEAGYRLRLGTLKGSAVPTVTAGVAALIYGIVMFIILLMTGQVAEAFIAPALLVAFGGATVGYGVLQLPAWAREREEQMEHIVARAQTLLGSGTTEPA